HISAAGSYKKKYPGNSQMNVHCRSFRLPAPHRRTSRPAPDSSVPGWPKVSGLSHVAHKPKRKIVLWVEPVIIEPLASMPVKPFALNEGADKKIFLLKPRGFCAGV